jgi:putative endonuclease
VDNQYYVYMMTNKHNTVLYTGVINDLRRRVHERKRGCGGAFTGRCNLTRLVYYEATRDTRAAIARAKQIKSGSRKKKDELVVSVNPKWRDLCDEFLARTPPNRYGWQMAGAGATRGGEGVLRRAPHRCQAGSLSYSARMT